MKACGVRSACGACTPSTALLPPRTTSHARHDAPTRSAAARDRHPTRAPHEGTTTPCLEPRVYTKVLNL
eukprot:1506220-Pleurochrysis_carterae.AAC.3